ncbi:MAG: glutathione S-transferase family protein [Comamonadaceae bacterium]|nr:MAG: glutathione S-transferase family protein [Comamonadaceae bacterium]
MELSLSHLPQDAGCRKIRMAMDYKQLPFALVEGCERDDGGAAQPQLPLLAHGPTTVAQADILGYLDRFYRELPVYPAEPRRYAEVRRWEALADTQLAAVVAVIGNWPLTAPGALTAQLLALARQVATRLCDALQAQLATREFLCTAISAADFAAYAQLVTAAPLGLEPDAARQPDLLRWFAAMRSRPEGRIDRAAFAEWQLRTPDGGDAARVRWGTPALEWLLANGQGAWVADQARLGRLQWPRAPESPAA